MAVRMLSRMTRAAAAFLALTAAAAAVPGAAPSPPVTALFETYLEGRQAEAVRQAAALDDLGPFRVQFIRDTPAWIGAGPDASRRRAAAAAFLLEVTHARMDEDWGRLTDLIEWTCEQLRAGPPTPFERAWDVASVSLAGRARARVWLLGEFAVLPHQVPRRRPPATPGRGAPTNANASPMHLMHAIERFPDDPELRLARIVAWTWGRDQEPIRNVSERNVMALFDWRPPQFEALVSFQPLFDDPLVGAEAMIRAGLIRAASSDHDGALRLYSAAQPKASDPARRYLAFFLAARELDALGRTDDAIQQYKKALEIIPAAESAVVALADLEFAGEHREAAAARLAAHFGEAGRPDDPGRLVGYGSYMRWPALRDAMRREADR